MKKAYKWIAAVVLTPFLLFVVLVALLYIPPVQNWAVRHVTAYVSEQTGYQVTVGRVSLVFPLDLGIERLRVLQASDSVTGVRDTLVYAQNIVVDVQLLPLFSQQVQVDALELSGVKLDTGGMIASVRVSGSLGRLFVQSHGIDLSAGHVRLDEALIDRADIDVALADSVPTDTTQSENNWSIALDHLGMKQSHVMLHLPGDSLVACLGLEQVEADGGLFELKEGRYRLAGLDWKDGTAGLDFRYEPETAGLDVNHLYLQKIVLGIDSLDYGPAGLSTRLRNFSFTEKSGLQLVQSSCQVQMDSSWLRIPQLHLLTTESSLDAQLNMALNAFSDRPSGVMEAFLNARLGKQDLMLFAAALPDGFGSKWPNYPLAVDLAVNGNQRRMGIAALNIKLPTAFDFHAEGSVESLTDMDRLRADINITSKAHNIDFLPAMAGASASSVHIPHGLSLGGKVKADGRKYGADLKLHDGNGTVSLKGNFNTGTLAYDASVKADGVHLDSYLPDMGMGRFCGQLQVEGKGTDFMSSRTRFMAKADVSQLQYEEWNLDSIKVEGSAENGVGHAVLDCHNALLDGLVSMDALLSAKRVEATLSCDLRKADLYSLHMVKKPFVVSLCAHVDVASNLKDYYKLQGLMSDVTFKDSVRSYRPEDVVLDVLTQTDTTRAEVECGDFHLSLNAQGGYERLAQQGSLLVDEVMKQVSDKYIDEALIREKLPLVSVNLSSGTENFFSRLLRRYDCQFDDFRLKVNSSPVSGLNGNLSINSLILDSMQIDTIRLAVISDSNRMAYKGQIRNNARNPQYVFNALFGGDINGNTTSAEAKLYDAKGNLGVGVGLVAAMEENGVRLRFGDLSPVLGYKAFHANEDNFVFMGSDRKISADMKLVSDDGTGVQLYSDDDNENALQDITLSLHRFDLEKVLAVVPYTPDMSGIMNGDFHLIQTEEELSVSTNLSVEKMVYEKCPMGDISTEFVYMPKSDGSHYVDGIFMSNGQEVASLSGTYASEGDGYLDACLELQRLPLLYVNGFIPNQVFGLQGYVEGDVDVKGQLSAPHVDGVVKFDSAYIASDPYGVKLRFDTDPVKITDSHLTFDEFGMYAQNNSPLDITGYIDFSRPSDTYLDLRVRATNYQLINAKENPRSEAYGKAYVNFYAMVKGPVEGLQVRGKLDVLGSTDLVYILRDSPLTTDNQLAELVTFTDFGDKEEEKLERPTLTGLNMDLTLSIDEGAHIMCALNTDKSNYVDLVGGGNLRMQYNPMDNVRLTGRYTLSNGEMKYSLPVIPLKTFTIQDGSYIEFSGDPMNPRLNITATEETKASVAENGGTGRSVLFQCGVVITKTLNDMGLEFIIDAPEDMGIHNELQTMSAENRGKLAVTMLTTGMYIADGNTNAFSMNKALGAFLNSQINAISGNALRTLDLSFGMDNTTDASGDVRTDYSFKFAKRFWNNRLNIVVGGKVSTGADVENQNNTFFDNVTFEYRLSQTSNQYLKLFYEKESYDWLEGNVGKYGAGFMWRRKLQHFRDLFRFKSDAATLPMSAPREKSDTIMVKKNEDNQ